ncbi:MAG: 30S ribosomal protein S12 methylthiotransferase RimO [Anaerovoracaceae bacterium]
MRIYIETLGCPKNVSDSEYTAGLLTETGHVIVGDAGDADAILVNTCGFINDAKEESIDKILELSQEKSDEGILIVSGCLSQRYGEGLSVALPEVDIILGVNEYQNLPQILVEHQKGKQASFFSSYEKEYSEMRARASLGVSYSAYLKIAEGCDNVCAYCVIPSIRGGYRSRKKENILEEAQRLAENGCKELILVAQDVTAYGIDLYGEYHLPQLLREMCRIDGIRWIRLMYCYEDRITDELIQVMAENNKICKYIDIPIQHASDRILESMNRRSTRASIEGTIRKLRLAMPDIHIRTTLITGFPGETREDAQIMEDFVENMRFERLGVFAYSKEEGTPAASMHDQVPKKVKLARRDRLMRLQQQISLEDNLLKIGHVYEVLVEEQEEENYIGRTVYDAPEIDNKVIFTSGRRLLPGEFALVKIEDGFDYDLMGHTVTE